MVEGGTVGGGFYCVQLFFSAMMIFFFFFFFAGGPLSSRHRKLVFAHGLLRSPLVNNGFSLIASQEVRL